LVPVGSNREPKELILKRCLARSFFNNSPAKLRARSTAGSPRFALAASDESLRGAGLSRQKTAYLRDLSLKVSSGELPLEEVESMEDDDLINHLVQVKGIGRWTAQMFLMFRLGRPDVLPELDLGIQNAIRRAYRMRKRPTPKQVKRIGAKWSPHSSVASWYLWRSLENGDGQLGAE
jgi:DNA-3-methyladenine glycosylase II